MPRPSTARLVFGRRATARGGGTTTEPLDRGEYEPLLTRWSGARGVRPQDLEPKDLFPACHPSRRWRAEGSTLCGSGHQAGGPCRPRTGKRPWAVVQLRPKNAERTAFELVGFQTNLAFDEQRRVFR